MPAQFAHGENILDVVRIGVRAQGESLWDPPEKHLNCQPNYGCRVETYLAVVGTGSNQVIIERIPSRYVSCRRISSRIRCD